MHYAFMHSHTPHTNTASTLLTATSGESSRGSSLWLDREASKSAEVVSKSAKGRGVAQGFPEGFPNLTSLISVVNMIIA